MLSCSRSFSICLCHSRRQMSMTLRAFPCLQLRNRQNALFLCSPHILIMFPIFAHSIPILEYHPALCTTFPPKGWTAVQQTNKEAGGWVNSNALGGSVARIMFPPRAITSTPRRSPPATLPARYTLLPHKSLLTYSTGCAPALPLGGCSSHVFSIQRIVLAAPSAISYCTRVPWW